MQITTEIILIIIFLLVMIALWNFKTEHFENLYQGSKSGFGFQEISGNPLFVNFYRKELGSDFELAGLLRRNRVFNNQPTLTNGNAIPNFIRTNPNQVRNPQAKGLDNGLTQISTGPSRVPIIIIPDIGASLIMGMWNRNNTEYVKQLDAYGNFESGSMWKCKDIQNTWTKLWFPDKKDGLSEYCWSSVARMDVDKQGIPINASGVQSMVPDISSSDSGLNFVDSSGTGKSPYSMLIKSLMSIGYEPGSTLFGAHYDFRNVIHDIQRLISMIVNLINIKQSKAIIIGHGFGAVIASNILQQINQVWVRDNIKAFIPICGTWGGVPKALRVYLSGDKMQSREEAKLVRDTSFNYDGLVMMLPSPLMYDSTTILKLDTTTLSSNKVPDIIKSVGSSINYDAIAEFNRVSLLEPPVSVFMMGGTGLQTESSFKYPMGSFDDPLYVYSEYIGDGTVPEITLRKIRSKWSQKSNTMLKLYQNAEHIQILSTYEPIKDLLDFIVANNST